MNIIDRLFSKRDERIKAAAAKEAREEINRAFKSLSFGGGSFGPVSGKANQLLQLISDCNAYEWMDERQKRMATRIIYNNFPPLVSAKNRIADMVGNPAIEAESDATARVLNDFLRGASIRTELNGDRETVCGMQGYFRIRTSDSLRDGMSFARDYFREDEYQGIVIHDPMRFDFSNFGEWDILTYTPTVMGWGGGTYYIDENSRYWNTQGYNFTSGSLWGLGMTEGAQFFGEVLLNMMVARKNAHIRFGNPLIFDIMGIPKEEILKYDAQDMEAFKAKQAEIVEMISKADSERDKGKRVRVSHAVPGSFTRDTYVEGQGLTPMNGWKDEFEMIGRLLLPITGIPPELVGFIASGGGFSGEQFRMLYRSISPMIHTIRTGHRKDFDDRFLTWAQVNKVPASAIRKGAYRFYFEDVDYLNEEEAARIDKLKIEAFRMQIETLTEMFLNNNMGAGLSAEELAKRFSNHFNLGWLYGEE